MNITSVKYQKYMDKTSDVVKATIDGKEMFVPLDPDNIHYAEIQKQVKEGTLTIKDAE